MNTEPSQPDDFPPPASQDIAHEAKNGRPKRPLNPGFAAKIWKPGQSGNPKGTTERLKIKRALERMGLSRKIRIKGEDGQAVEVTWLDAFVQRLWTDGINGKPAAQRIIAETLWPQKGNRTVVQQNLIHLSFELDAPPQDNQQSALYDELIDQLPEPTTNGEESTNGQPNS